ncbi:MAG TPA: carcinine hydrolase/isopenicillin-N N-acyltransferase family protein [Gammaproteobacteria bacterium]|nr:carcinine hydrolase/isopenicillin-N N-acyltransferase family protein [Gammaproteobacteria bacterium]
MQSHQPPNKSDLAQLINRHPGYSLLLMMTTLAAPAFDLRALPLLYMGLRLGGGFYNEIKRRTAAPHKVESQFENTRVTYEEVQTGRLTHDENQLPVVKINTDHPYLGPLTEARLMACYYPDFHANYFRYLFLLARLLKGPWKKSAVEFINQEARRRGIKLDDANIQLHYVVKEVYGYIEKYNKTVPFYLQITDEFTLEHFRAIILFCEIEKGLGRANGCTSSVIDKKNGKKEAIHLTDWFTFGSFQDWQIHTLKMVSGQTVFSSGIIPGIVTITACNENGLFVAYNEAGGKIGNRENPAGGHPGLLLTHNIAAECKTFKAVENYLNTHQPASGNIFTVAARDGHGIIENMPNQSNVISRVLDKNEPFCVATNHFRDPVTKKDILESACILGRPVVGSDVRLKNIESATSRHVNGEEKMSLPQIAKVSESKDTVKAMLCELDYKDPEEYRLHLNVTNGFAASTGHYNTVDLTQLSTWMRHEVAEIRKQLAPKMAGLDVQLSVDKSLINLMKKLGELDQSHPVLARQLSDFYSSLTEQCKLSETGSKKALLSRRDILLIADRTVEMVTAVQNRKMSHAAQFSQYERFIQVKTGKARYSVSYDSARLMDGLFAGVMSALFTHFTTNLVQQNASPAFLQWASELFVADLSALFNTRWMAPTIVAALSASLLLFKRPPLVARADAVVNTLRKSFKAG